MCLPTNSNLNWKKNIRKNRNRKKNMTKEWMQLSAQFYSFFSFFVFHSKSFECWRASRILFQVVHNTIQLIANCMIICSKFIYPHSDALYLPLNIVCRYECECGICCCCCFLKVSYVFFRFYFVSASLFLYNVCLEDVHLRFFVFVEKIYSTSAQVSALKRYLIRDVSYRTQQA